MAWVISSPEKRHAEEARGDDRSAFIVTLQLEPETESHPFQPMKIEPNAGLALSVTVVPVT